MDYPTASPNDINNRYYGNEMFAQGFTPHPWPPNNHAGNVTATFDSNNILVSPVLTTTFGPPPPPTQTGFYGTGAIFPVSITVTPPSPSIAIGATQAFVATENFNDGSTANITTSALWTSGTLGVATINSTGLATGVGAGSSTISAAKDGIIGVATLTVAGGPPPTPVSITVTPAAPSILVGSTQQFVATENYNDGSSVVVTTTATWSSNAPSIAIVSTTGLATAISGGISTISATKDGLSGNALLTVTPSITLVSVSVAPLTASVVVGGVATFTATGTYSDGGNANVTTLATWTSGTPAIATIGGSTGIAVGVSAGVTSITATYLGISGPASLTVTNPAVIPTTFHGTITMHGKVVVHP